MMNSVTEHRPLRWGILGAARIAGKSLIPAIRAAGGEIVSVGASSRERAESFARDHSIPSAHEGYSSVLEDPQVEAVYIPLANGLHKTWALEAARAGKPCLCEKPLALSFADAEEMTAAFTRARLPLMEAFMWRHHTQIARARDEIAAGAIGELCGLHGHFSFMLDRPADYRWRADQGGGALWDIGCYPVNAARLFFGAEPVVASAGMSLRANDSTTPGVDVASTAWLDFGSGRMASVYCSFGASFHQSIELIGTRARMWISSPWLSVGRETRMLIQQGDEKRLEKFEPMNAYVSMINTFTHAVRSGEPLPDPAETGLAQARAMDMLLRSARSMDSEVK